MKPTKTALMALLLTAAIAVPAVASAQRGRRQRMGRDQGFGGAGAMGRNFEAEAPKVGEPMPDVLVYDDEGNPHRLPELLGEHYSVLILGCLT
jgi:hypothetical protein